MDIKEKINAGSEGYPFLGIANQFGVPYERVLAQADAYRCHEFNHRHLMTPEREMQVLESNDLDADICEAVYFAVCKQQDIREGQYFPV